MPRRWSAVVCLVVVLLICGCQAASVRRGSMPPKAPSAALQGLLLDVRTQQFISFETLVADVATAQVVAVGEEHYHAAIQAFELRLLQALTERRPQHVALGMEFLERDAQATVAAYLDGTIGRAAFQERLAASPAFMELYFPLVRYARLHGLPVVSLNIPRRIARQVAEHGLGKTLERLSRTDQAYLPASLTPISPRYRAYFLEAVAPYHSPQGKQADYFVEASHLKDDTMAQSIGAFLDRHADFTILAIAGRFHFDYGIAIPTILRQQHPQASIRRITTMSVAAEEGLDLQRLAQEDLADYVRFFPPASTQRSTAAAPLPTAGQD
jgi:uncharacterized iron-regulated protein